MKKKSDCKSAFCLALIIFSAAAVIAVIIIVEVVKF